MYINKHARLKDETIICIEHEESANAPIIIDFFSNHQLDEGGFGTPIAPHLYVWKMFFPI